MQRINVVGTSCSGKTTLARALARRFSLPYVELDALFWGADWIPVADETFREGVSVAVAGERWVIDGGYAKVRPVIWGRADTVVWLDYPLALVLGRWARRTVVRIRSGAEFWPGTGNRESLRRAVGRQSLLWWILRTHRSRRRRMLAEVAAHRDVRVVRLRSPRETDRWLASLG